MSRCLLFFILFITQGVSYASSRMLCTIPDIEYSYSEEYALQYLDMGDTCILSYFDKSVVKNEDFRGAFYQCQILSYKPTWTIEGDGLTDVIIQRNGVLQSMKETLKQQQKDGYYSGYSSERFEDILLPLDGKDRIIAVQGRYRSAPSECSTDYIKFTQDYGAMKASQEVAGYLNLKKMEICGNVCEDVSRHHVKRICKEKREGQNIVDYVARTGFSLNVYREKCINIQTGKTTVSDLKCGVGQ